MSELLVKQVQNLSNVFILPLIRRSPYDFRTGTFINSYIDLEEVQIVVEVENMQDVYKEYAHYEFSIDKGYKTYIFYNIPERFHSDVAMFVAGKYSCLSSEAQTFIRKYSRLPYNLREDGSVDKAIWFHVMEKSDKLRASLEKQLGCKIGKYTELASKPHKSNYFQST